MIVAPVTSLCGALVYLINIFRDWSMGSSVRPSCIGETCCIGPTLPLS